MRSRRLSTDSLSISSALTSLAAAKGFVAMNYIPAEPCDQSHLGLQVCVSIGAQGKLHSSGIASLKNWSQTTSIKGRCLLKNLTTFDGLTKLILFQFNVSVKLHLHGQNLRLRSQTFLKHGHFY